MNVIILGSGGREHALAWKIAQSPLLENLYIAPGNSGTESLGINVPLDPSNFPILVDFIIDKDIDIVIVGPEDPLVKGVSDYLQMQPELKDIIVVGPSTAAAQLEGSKEFAKEFMEHCNIPTAKYRSFLAAEISAGKEFLREMKAPYVLKADGLAAGKGVVILDDLAAAQAELEEMLNGKFGSASEKVVIEEFLSGIELSVFVLTDGEGYHILPNAKDYKRIGEGDTGLNTGGMGAVSPVPFADEKFMQKVIDRIVDPTIQGLKEQGLPYYGFIFFGLINVDGDPYVIEYNVRMGDPESEVVIPRIESDLLEIMSKMGSPEFGKMKMQIDPRSAATVMLVSGGYPEAYEKQKEITGLDSVDDSIVFHAGANRLGDKVYSSGGRVLAITSMNKNWKAALENSYKNAGKIHFDKMYYRKDIGFDL
jgi:phosphoribosylamine--glycine ligase